MLKLLAGAILNDVLQHGARPEDVWPEQADMDLFAHFPVARHRSSQWITSFEAFVDDLGLKNALTQQYVLLLLAIVATSSLTLLRKSVVIFAFALSFGGIRYNTNENSAILITVSEGLTIIIPDSLTGPATYLDVPLENIGCISLDSQPNSQSQTPSHVVVLNLHASNEHINTCYINANGCDHNAIALAFISINDAKTLKKLIQADDTRPAVNAQHSLVTANGNRQISVSQGVDVSQYSSEDELAMQVPSKDQSSISDRASAVLAPDNQHLLSGTSHAATLLVQGSRASTGTSISNGFPPGSKNSEMAKEQTQGPARTLKELGHIVSMSTGVDVSKTESQRVTPVFGPLHSDKERTGGIRGQRKGKVQEGILKNFEYSSESGLPSSMRWQKGAEGIENGPEFREENLSGSPKALGSQSPHDQAEDFDSAYDATPKVNKPQGDRSSLSILPKETLPNHMRPEERGDHDRSNGNASTLSAITDGSELSNRADVPRGSQKSLARRHNPDLSATGDGSLDNNLLKNSNSCLLNGEDGDQARLKTKATTDKADTGHIAKPVGRVLPKGKPLPRVKAKASVQRRLIPDAKRAETNGKPEAPSKIPEEGIDEYEVQNSPGGSKAANTLSESRPKARPAPMNQAIQKRKSVATNSSEPTSLITQDNPSKNESLKNGASKDQAPKAGSGKTVETAEETVWEESLAASDDLPKDLQHKTTKLTKKKFPQAPSGKNRTQPPLKAKPKPKPKSKPPPLALAAPRSRRAAAIKANKKIQDVEEEDDISEVDEPSDKPQKSELGPNNSKSKKETIENLQCPQTNGGIGTSTHDSSRTGSMNITKLNGVKKSVKIAKASKADILRENESPDKVGSVKKHEAKPANHEMPVQSNPASANANVPVESASNTSTSADKNVVVTRSPEFEESEKQKLASMNEALFVIDSVPKGEGNVIEDGIHAIAEKVSENYHPEAPIEMVGDTEGSHFHEAMPDADEGQSQLEEARTPAAAFVIPNEAEKIPSLGSVQHHDSSVLKSDSIKSHGDPFGAKLKDLLPEPSIEQSKASCMNGKQQTQREQPSQHDGAEEGYPQAQKSNTVREAAKRAEPQNGSLPRQHKASDQTKQPAKLSKWPLKQAQNGRPVTDDKNATHEKASLPAPPTHPKPKDSTAKGGGTIAKEKTPAPVISRRTEIISWNSTGPRNQGTASSNKKGQTQYISSAESNEVLAEQPAPQKRKVAPFLDDPAPWEHDSTKRQKQETSTPRHNCDYVPRMIAEPRLSISKNRPHGRSSQSTRVNYNGSPMPLTDIRQGEPNTLEGITEDDHHNLGPTAFIDDEDNGMIPANDDYWQENELPAERYASHPVTNGVNNKHFSGNSKQLPSSPHAPSAFEIEPAHYVLEDGDLLNARTRKTIVPTEPHDPFIGGEKKPPSSFMAALRKSSAAEARRKSDEARIQRRQFDLAKNKLVGDDDPDKTLVEPPAKRRKVKYVMVSSSSTTPETASREHSPSEEISNGQDDDSEVAWRKALEPHQDNVADILSLVSHVSLQTKLWSK